MAKLDIKYSYPDNPYYFYETDLFRRNLDEERVKSLRNGKGFVITDIQPSLKKELKSPNGIFSKKFGQNLDDVSPFKEEFKCECGFVQGKIYENLTCPKCKKRVKYVGDDLNYFGWIVLQNDYSIIHPNLYKSLEVFFGQINVKSKNKKEYIIERIILPDKRIDKDGHLIQVEKPKDEPFYGIGLMEFKDRFREIMNYYHKKNQKKNEYYVDIMENEDKVFTQSIPVYTLQLRPYKIDIDKFKTDKFRFEGTNGIYHIMTKLTHQINNDSLHIFRKSKPKLQFLYDLNMKYQSLYDELDSIFATKKGIIRNLMGGRYSFTSRDVIIPDPKLEIDEITMPYTAMCELMKQSIINVLHKTYNMSYNDAYLFWYNGVSEKNKIIEGIINQFIKNFNGVAVLINRNPSLKIGSLLYMRVVGIHDSYTMKVPLDILGFLKGDFDGDVLNLMYITNADFRDACNLIYNPRNSMQISRNDGWTEVSVLPYKDLLINMNTLANESRQYYTGEQIERLETLVKMHM